MARGKNHNASVARRLAEAEADIKDWKRHAANQRREIASLTAEVKLMPAMKQRISVLEMQLDLATCSEIADLNAAVAHLRDQVAEARANSDVLYRAFRRQVRATGQLAESNLKDFASIAAAASKTEMELFIDVGSSPTRAKNGLPLFHDEKSKNAAR